jgi:hypothetical protein
MSKSNKRKLEATAYHEAGHAVVALHLRHAVKRVSIIPDHDTLGWVLGRKVPGWFEPDVERDGRHRNWIQEEVQVLFAGGLAEARWTGRQNHVGAAHDYQMIDRLTENACGSEEGIHAYRVWLRECARDLVNQWWFIIEHMAAVLMLEREISGRHARQVWGESITKAR